MANDLTKTFISTGSQRTFLDFVDLDRFSNIIDSAGKNHNR